MRICGETSQTAWRTDLSYHLRGAGIAKTVIMKIGAWRTRSVFERYAIVSRNDIADAMRKLQTCEAQIEINTQSEITPGRAGGFIL